MVKPSEILGPIKSEAFKTIGKLYNMNKGTPMGALTQAAMQGAALLPLLFGGRGPKRRYRGKRRPYRRPRRNYRKKGKRKYKKGYSYKKRKPRTRPRLNLMARMRHDIAQLKKKVNRGLGKFAHVYVGTGTLTVSTDEGCTYSTQPVTRTTEIESFLSAVPTVDYAGTITNANFSTGTAGRDITFTNIYSNCVTKNSYNVPVSCTIYALMNKFDSSISPEASITNGLADRTDASGLTPASIAHFAVRPTHSEQFTNQWKIVGSKTKVLQNGQVMSLKWRTKGFKYNPAQSDTHTSTYQTKLSGMAFLVRIQGVVSHGISGAPSGPDGSGIGKCGVDLYCKRKYTISYEAGGDIDRTHFTDSTGTMAGDSYTGKYQEGTIETYLAAT